LTFQNQLVRFSSRNKWKSLADQWLDLLLSKKIKQRDQVQG